MHLFPDPKRHPRVPSSLRKVRQAGVLGRRSAERVVLSIWLASGNQPKRIYRAPRAAQDSPLSIANMAASTKWQLVTVAED